MSPLGDFHLSWVYLWVFTIIFILLSQYAHWFENQILHWFGRIHFWLLIPILTLLGYLLIELSPEGIPSFIYYQF
jgi:hypothetical protein